MNDKHFLHACELIKTNLFNLDMNRAFNSIGSNVFFEFGKGKEVVFKNGRKRIKKEWIIWISDASWRVSKKGKYIVGSGDSPKTIQLNIQNLLGKRFHSFQFLSQFLDIEFNFDDDYQITTFFNWSEENQWTVFLPDQTNVGVDCSDQDTIQNVQEIATHLPIIDTYKKLDFPPKEIVLNGITYNKYDLPTFHFENDISINLENCTWRLEKNNGYIIGYLDGDKSKFSNKLSELTGKRLKQIDIANAMQDSRFQFEDGYILKTFTCCRRIAQWKICIQNKTVFSADILLN